MLQTFLQIVETDAELIVKQLTELCEIFTTPMSIEFPNGKLIHVRTKNDLSYLLIGMNLMRNK